MSESQGGIPTPISVIIQLFQKRQVKPLIIDGLDKMDIRSQLNCLDPARCNSKNCRKYVYYWPSCVTKSVFCNDNDYLILSDKIVLNHICICYKIQYSEIVEILQQSNKDLSGNAFKKIRLKSILSKYYKHWYLINATDFNMIQSWNVQDIALSIIVHCIKNDKERDQKKLLLTWKFLSFLVEYFQKHNDGKELIDKYIEPQQIKGGFGLTIVKEICREYNQRTGKYVKVKKQLTLWSKIIIERYKKEINDDQVETKEDDINNKKWYWYCDEGGKIEWIPYKNEDQTIINDAWLNGKINVIVMERFKIEFEKEQQYGSPAGQQYDYKRQNSWRRPIIYGEPNKFGLLNDILCREQPK